MKTFTCEDFFGDGASSSDRHLSTQNQVIDEHGAVTASEKRRAKSHTWRGPLLTAGRVMLLLFSLLLGFAISG